MNSLKKKMDKTPKEHQLTNSTSNNCCCFFCIMEEKDPSTRKSRFRGFLKTMPLIQGQELVLVVSGIWSIAMSNPNDEELPSLGIFECMANLITKAIRDKDWLLRDQNIYIPYYAAHVIGSYTMNNVALSKRAIDSGVLPPLIELLKGEMTWVEQRVAVRAIGHLASYEKTFKSVEAFGGEIVNLAMRLASTCLEVVYNEFVGVEDRGKRCRLKYQSDLLTRGVGGVEMENRKAEEWASQIQCWSIHLLTCFAIKGKCLDLICNSKFLRDLSEMWGGLVNHTSPGGVGLIRVLCYTKYGRKCIAQSRDVVISLCNLSRSSDDWQYMGIDCLLLLLSDLDTRYKIIEIATFCLIDLVELRTLGLRSSNIGDAIARTLLLDFKDRKVKIKNLGVQIALEKVWGLKVEKREKEKKMSEEKLEERRVIVRLMKQQANNSFNKGKIEEALEIYTKAIELCPLRYRKQRVVLYSNKAQCRLLLGEIDGAISDTTRALSLSNPPNSHAKCLWRRSQAYDIKGLAKHSLMDCLMFINCSFNNTKNNNKYGKRDVKIIPYYAVRMITKQMESTWLFSNAQSNKKNETSKVHIIKD